MAERVSAKLKRKKKMRQNNARINEKKNSERSEKLDTIIKRNKMCLYQEK